MKPTTEIMVDYQSMNINSNYSPFVRMLNNLLCRFIDDVGNMTRIHFLSLIKFKKPMIFRAAILNSFI